jgi:hypothetical protein
MSRAVKWTPQPEIDFPCADISINWTSERGAVLRVLMHFSRVVDGFSKDLELIFRTPYAFQWEDESFGLIDVPAPLPRCDRERFSGWAYPTLIIEGSPWREIYINRRFSADDPDRARVVHYYLVSMNDLAHVLAIGEPKTVWMDPVDA